MFLIISSFRLTMAKISIEEERLKVIIKTSMEELITQHKNDVSTLLLQCYTEAQTLAQENHAI